MDLGLLHQSQHQHQDQVVDQDCSSDPTFNKRHTQEGNLHNSFTGIVYQVEVPLRNQGTSTSPIVMKTTRNLPLQQNTGKGSKKKSSRRDQPETQAQPSTSNSGTNTTSVFLPRNTGTGRPHIQCSACGENNHFRKDCHQDKICNRCRSRSHATQMCQAPTNKGKNNNICVYCGSSKHTSGNCTCWSSDNREEPSSYTKGSPQSWTTLRSKYQKLRSTQRKYTEFYTFQASTYQKNWKITSQLVNRYTQIILFLTETTGMTRTELDVNKLDLMRHTMDSTLQIIITIITNHFH